MKRKINANVQRKHILPGVESYEGERMIDMIRRKIENKEQIPVIMDTAYTEKKAGVLEAYNIRTDRFEVGQREAERIGAYKAAKKKKMQGGEPAKAVENSKEEVE